MAGKANKPDKVRLTSEQKHFIVGQLACYVRIPEVMEEFEKTFGFAVSRNLVGRYDPTRSWNRELSEALTNLFYTTRKNYENSLLGMHPISKRIYRIDKLGSMFERAYDKGNHPFAANLLKQAADEMAEMPGAKQGKGRGAQDDQAPDEGAGYDGADVEVDTMRQILGDAIVTALNKSANAPTSSTKQ
ncbi:DUF2280 domain-containing protein [Sphingopyxis flava]|uniref:Uncharacterized protein n=1 Tax=Sphingopyxis flava TaxID=1507287 RepID=A0A1T5AC92_9SPHN|nr:DUF2280 domain-containing protein [Sphingopyxis flava]SKB32515.1 hypothetical protein SAMN06295937_100385 [Sphingopyxis flava]